MSQQIEQMLFPLADALQTTLEIDSNGAVGQMSRIVPLGPWSLQLSGKITTLVYTPQLVAVVVHVRKDLYLLMATTKQGHELRAVMFDGAKAGVKSGVVPGNLKKAFANIKLAAQTFLKYDHPSESWRPINAFDLD